MAVSRGPAPGAAGLHLVGGLPLLRPEEQVLEAMMFPVKKKVGHFVARCPG